MRLAEYLHSRSESTLEFSERSGVPYRTIQRIAAREMGCQVDTALKIIRASHEKPTPTGGWVSLEDLVVEDHAA